MRSIEQWIWLPKSRYPKHQTSEYNMQITESSGQHQYAVVSLTRKYQLDRGISRILLRFSGDTFFALCCCNTFLASGPASAGGDFLEEHCNHALPNYYATEMTLTADEYPFLLEGTLDFQAQVRMTPARMFDQSKGHGGFFLTAFVRFADGTETVLLTDDTWQCRLLSAYTAPEHFDNSNPEEPVCFAEVIPNIWNCETAPIMPCAEKPLVSVNGVLCESDRSKAMPGIDLVIPAGSSLTAQIPFDLIYAGYLSADVKTSGRLILDVYCRELEEEGTSEHYIFVKDDTCRSLEMHSAGNLLISASNEGEEDACLHLDYIISYYPVYTSAVTSTSDEELNLVFNVCKHTLKQCRQTLHLDSPRHCEPLHVPVTTILNP